jgi:hypothetical protein
VQSAQEWDCCDDIEAMDRLALAQHDYVTELWERARRVGIKCPGNTPPAFNKHHACVWETSKSKESGETKIMDHGCEPSHGSEPLPHTGDPGRG